MLAIEKVDWDRQRLRTKSGPETGQVSQDTQTLEIAERSPSSIRAWGRQLRPSVTQAEVGTGGGADAAERVHPREQ